MPHASGNLNAVHHRHLNVEHHDVEVRVRSLKLADCARTINRLNDDVPELPEHLGDEFAARLVVGFDEPVALYEVKAS